MDEIKLTTQISVVYVAGYLGQEGGLEKCLRKVEMDLLNGWPFGETAKKKPPERTLGRKIRQEILALTGNGGYLQIKHEALAILAQVITSLGYCENEDDDRAVNDTFNALAEQFDSMEIGDFLDQFEAQVLNHPGLKNPNQPEPTQELLL